MELLSIPTLTVFSIEITKILIKAWKGSGRLPSLFYLVATTWFNGVYTIAWAYMVRLGYTGGVVPVMYRNLLLLLLAQFLFWLIAASLYNQGVKPLRDRVRAHVQSGETTVQKLLAIWVK